MMQERGEKAARSGVFSQQLLKDLQLTAASFIVTIYGDIVVPRGEVLWMGSLIDVCQRVGISENLVRTATSRLVAAGRLEGERSGRRSFYRLAPAARTEFAGAARLLYAPQVEAARWFVLHAPGLSQDDARRHCMARLGGDVWLCPDLREGTPASNLKLEVSAPIAPADLAALAGFWDLSILQARYEAMLARFGALARALAAGTSIAADDALICRLLLVHVYRHALLRDPCLPPAALPPDWHGTEARHLFRSLYGALSAQADAQIGRMLEGHDGPLPARSPESDARLSALSPDRPGQFGSEKALQKNRSRLFQM